MQPKRSEQKSIHEAAHAVLAVYFNLPFTKVSSNLCPTITLDGELGVITGVLCGLRAVKGLEKEVRYVALAGCVAESIYEWQRFIEKGIKPPFETLQALIRKRFPRFGEDMKVYGVYAQPRDSNLSDVDIETVEMLIRENWSKINKLGAKLCEKGEMTQNEVMQFLSCSC